MTDLKPIIDRYHHAKERLLLLDYDGTLVAIAPTPDQAVPTPATLRILANLCSTAHTEVVVITGRGLRDIRALLGPMPLRIIAEHGMTETLSEVRRELITAEMKKAKAQCPGSFIEPKRNAVAWHYRNASNGDTVSRELIVRLRSIASKNELKVLDGNKVIEVLPEQNGKGAAVSRLLKEKAFDLIIAIGDDVTDEEMFRVLRENEAAITLKVGQGQTAAQYSLSSPQAVLELLDQL